ncbi:MAG TPA: DNA cytosine methyltransferase [Pyrinomonadaceae bacterium]|nr:DNA cytosine methyltransferase [Pyrinomonadaceae bacterium]
MFPKVVVDCFAGAGGLSLGLKEAGFDIKAAFDNSQFAVDTYAYNIGKHIIKADANEISGKELLSIAGCSADECVAVVGGPPCQGFSVQRRGLGRDSRNDLILEFLRIVSEIRPPLFLMENVSAIRSNKNSEYLERFIKYSSEIGYRLDLQVLNAADYGVPQHRKRAFIVGERQDRVKVFQFPKPVLSQATWLTVRDAFVNLPVPTDSPDSNQSFPNHKLINTSELNRLRISHVPPGGGRQHLPDHLRLPCHEVSVDVAGHRNVYGRLEWDSPAGTITTKCNSFTRGKFGHPEENRNITMREAARLQGFPDTFVFLGGTVATAHQIGNAVPPPLARHLGNSLRDALYSSISKPDIDEQLVLRF